MHYRDERDPDHWTVPYLPIDPTDIGRNYDADVIRIKQSVWKRWRRLHPGDQVWLESACKMREAMGYVAKVYQIMCIKN